MSAFTLWKSIKPKGRSLFTSTSPKDKTFLCCSRCHRLMPALSKRYYCAFINIFQQQTISKLKHNEVALSFLYHLFIDVILVCVYGWVTDLCFTLHVHKVQVLKTAAFQWKRHSSSGTGDNTHSPTVCVCVCVCHTHVGVRASWVAFIHLVQIIFFRSHQGTSFKQLSLHEILRH